MNQLSKAAGHKIDTQTPSMSTHQQGGNNRSCNSHRKNSTPRNEFHRGGRDLYPTKAPMLLKGTRVPGGTERHLREQRTVVKMAAPPGAAHRVMALPSQFLQPFCRNGKASPRLHMESQGPQVRKTILQKKEVAGLTLTTEQQRSNSLALAWGQTCRPCGRVRSREGRPYMCGHVISNRRARAIQWGKDSLLRERCWKHRIRTRGDDGESLRYIQKSTHSR